MIVHEVEPCDGKWCVVAKGRKLSEDRVVARFAYEHLAREAMQKLNAEQMGRPGAPLIGPDAHKSGCTCGRGTMLPDSPRCPVHG